MASGSDGADIFKKVDVISDEESSHNSPEQRLVLGRKKRRRVRLLIDGGLTVRQRLVDLRSCRQLVQKRCGGKCSKNCLQPFSRGLLFEKWMDFRKHWHDLHKIDQDRLDFQLQKMWSCCIRQTNQNPLLKHSNQGLGPNDGPP